MSEYVIRWVGRRWYVWRLSPCDDGGMAAQMWPDCVSYWDDLGDALTWCDGADSVTVFSR
jgi:hypothetical protein